MIVGTSGRGRVYRVHGSERWELLFDMDEQQALTVLTRDGRLAFVVFRRLSGGLIRVVTARDMEDNERRLFRRK